MRIKESSDGPLGAVLVIGLQYLNAAKRAVKNGLRRETYVVALKLPGKQVGRAATEVDQTKKYNLGTGKVQIIFVRDSGYYSML